MKIFIIGYMAAGKTTFGKALAEKLNTTFIDLDQYIEEKSGSSISTLFATKGESAFREIENEMLKKAVEETPDAVIACGGGTPCYHDNMEFMNKTGLTIFIETSTPVLISRLQLQNAQRPIVAGKTNDEIRETVLTQLCDRLPYYMEAKLKWHGDDLENKQEIESNVENFVSSYPSVFR